MASCLRPQGICGFGGSSHCGSRRAPASTYVTDAETTNSLSFHLSSSPSANTIRFEAPFLSSNNPLILSCRSSDFDLLPASNLSLFPLRHACHHGGHALARHADRHRCSIGTSLRRRSLWTFRQRYPEAGGWCAARRTHRRECSGIKQFRWYELAPESSCHHKLIRLFSPLRGR